MWLLSLLLQNDIFFILQSDILKENKQQLILIISPIF